ncbi:rCG48324 [Rattus norvegicus]|uniref:RCG48324 n=1 Tax=Rattus norvegicus TaxID=10116 RepID=A6I0I2_RAT|nr:rCG48324 [Rattus norvegicus]
MVSASGLSSSSYLASSSSSSVWSSCGSPSSSCSLDWTWVRALCHLLKDCLPPLPHSHLPLVTFLLLQQ